MRTFVVRELKKVKDMYSVCNSVGEVVIVMLVWNVDCVLMDASCLWYSKRSVCVAVLGNSFSWYVAQLKAQHSMHNDVDHLE